MTKTARSQVRQRSRPVSAHARSHKPNPKHEKSMRTSQSTPAPAELIRSETHCIFPGQVTKTRRSSTALQAKGRFKTVARPGDASTTKIFRFFDVQVDQAGSCLHHARTSENECVCTQYGAGVLCEGKRLCHKTARASFRSKTHVSCEKLLLCA